MATHQQIGGISDAEMIERMVSSHEDRFGADFWNLFDREVSPRISDAPAIMDVGCGPGLLLRDLRNRYPDATLFGTDVTAAMIDYAQQLDIAGQAPIWHQHDATTEPLPCGDAQIDLISMVAVLHVFDQPLNMLGEIHRALKDNGVFLLQDWIRNPLPAYLERMTEGMDEDIKPMATQRFFSLFAVHNKYSIDDWLWLLAQGGFNVEHEEELSSVHFRTFICTKL